MRKMKYFFRYVSWTAYVMRGNELESEITSLPGAPFSRYYAQEPADEGIIMETQVEVSHLRMPDCPYLNQKGQLRVRIEWLECHLLFQATYHKYDDVCRIHNQQMRREIAVLQAENYSLERQLFSYQKSLAYAQAQQQQQQQTPTHHHQPPPPQPPSQHPPHQLHHTQHQLPHTPTHPHPHPLHPHSRQSPSTHHPSTHLERSASTDTEYA